MASWLLKLLVPVVFAQSWLFSGVNWVNSKSVDFGSSNTNKYFTGGDVLNDLTWNDDFTICAWVYPVLNPSNGIIISKLNTSGTGWELDYTGGPKFQFYSSPDAAAHRIQLRTANTYAASNWYFLCLTSSGNSSATGMTLYVNGTADTTTIFNTSAANWTTSAAFNIASHSNGSTAQGGMYRGKIDEVTIWNDDLTSTEINTLYHSGTPINPATASFWGTKNIAYWRMGDLSDSSSTLVDRGAAGRGLNVTGANVVAGDLVGVVPP